MNVTVPTDVVPRYQSMAQYKTKQADKRRQGSQTPGHQKNENCHATAIERYFCRRNRSYKHPEYATWCGQSGAIPGASIGRQLV
jgi:hypothetical protein